MADGTNPRPEGNLVLRHEQDARKELDAVVEEDARAALALDLGLAPLEPRRDELGVLGDVMQPLGGRGVRCAMACVRDSGGDVARHAILWRGREAE